MFDLINFLLFLLKDFLIKLSKLFSSVLPTTRQNHAIGF